MTILDHLRAIFGGRPVPYEAPVDLTPVPSSIDRRLLAEPSAGAVRACTSIDDLSAWIGHYDGYTREAALRRAAQLASPLLLPAIVERLNDWVPQVRVLAQEVLLGMLAPISNGEALRLLPVVQRLRQAGRADHSAWIASFERAVVEKVGMQTIIEGLLDPDVQIARACFKVVEAERLAPSEDVIARLLPATRDIVLARHAVEAIFRLAEPLRGPLFRRALASGFGMVRAIASKPLLAEENAENDALAIRMVTDSHNWVRLIASGYLKRRGIDSAAILAEGLRADGASSTTMRACLAGLAELGCTDQLELVRSLTSHPLARVQLSACLACLRLDPSCKDEIVRSVLRSPHRRVRRLALQMVREDGACLDTETGLCLMAEHDDMDMMFAFVKRESCALLELILQMEPRSRQDPSLRARLKQELTAWIDDSRKMYSKPTAAQRVLFQRDSTFEALATLLPTGDPQRLRRLKFELDNA